MKTRSLISLLCSALPFVLALGCAAETDLGSSELAVGGDPAAPDLPSCWWVDDEFVERCELLQCSTLPRSDGPSSTCRPDDPCAGPTSGGGHGAGSGSSSSRGGGTLVTPTLPPTCTPGGIVACPTCRRPDEELPRLGEFELLSDPSLYWVAPRVVITNGYDDYAIYEFNFALNGTELVDLENDGILVGGENPGNIAFHKPLFLRFSIQYAAEDLPVPENFWTYCEPGGGQCEFVGAGEF